jgi:hypothetical protein
VNSVVHADKEDSSTGFSGIRMPTVEEDGYMMIPMEENQWFLSQYNKYSVDQFWDFAEDEQHHPYASGTLSIVTSIITGKVMVRWLVQNHPNHIRNSFTHANKGKNT